MATIDCVLREQIISDPGLPRGNPTESFWQLPPHDLANIQSNTLPQQSDFAVIGSGMTGFSVVKTILEHSKLSQSSVTVLEARTLCSGATGRNGGGMASPILYYFHDLVEEIGKDRASQFARFVYHNLEKMHELGNLSDEIRSRSEIRRVRDVAGFRDEETRSQIMQSVKLLQELVPEANLDVQEISAKEAEKTFHVKGIISAILVNAGVNWPYRLVTELWSHFYKKYADRLSIETSTSVLSITREDSDSDYPYLLSTSRGEIRARHVVHATNGYAGHLLPALRGILVPCRGMMSAHEPEASFRAAEGTSFSNFGRTYYVPESDILQGFVYYGHQNPYTGDVFWGGDTDEGTGIFTADDTLVSPKAQEDLYASVPKHLTGNMRFKPKSIWTGVMGNTVDGMPLVGAVPESFSGRRQGHDSKEWICAGFNGAGMSQCLLSGEGLVKMIAGDDVTGILPDTLLMSEDRLNMLEPEVQIRKRFPNL